jgi:ssDNA-binding replication factor A large subunit
MKIITNVELSLGYEHWKQKMLENESFRVENKMNLLAYGHEDGNENKVWVVMDVPSMEHMASVINKPEMIKLREEAGAIIETQKMIKLVE